MAKQSQSVATKSYAVGEIMEVNPNDVIVSSVASERGRFEAPDMEAVARMAISLNEVGQLQEVECAQLPGEKWKPNFGNTRATAAQMLVNGFKGPNNKEIKNAGFKLRIRITETPKPGEAVLRNIKENLDRIDRTPMDDAVNQQTLREMGWKDDKIAKEYGVDKATVSRFSNLLKLPIEAQKAVHTYKITKSAAIEMVVCKLQPTQILSMLRQHGENLTAVMVREASRAIVETPPAVTGTTPTVAEAAKDTPIATPSENGTKSKTAKAQRTMSQLKEFLSDKAKADDVTKPVKTICATILAYGTGDISEATATAEILKLDEMLAELLEDEKVISAVKDSKKKK